MRVHAYARESSNLQNLTDNNLPLSQAPNIISDLCKKFSEIFIKLSEIYECNFRDFTQKSPRAVARCTLLSYIHIGETTLWIAHRKELSPSSGTDGPTTQLEKTSKSGNIRRNPLIFSYKTCTLQRKAVTLPCFSAQPLQGALKAHQSIRVTSSFGNTN